MSFAERILKKQRLDENRNRTISAYVSTKFISPTSNDVERLFSLSKRIFSEKRRGLKPETLESLVFLKTNRCLWNLALVSLVVNEEEPCNEEEEEDEMFEECI